MASVTLGLVFGFALGMRHALEPDHLAAVATLVQARHRRSTAIMGAFWGAGHSASLLAVGCVLAALNAHLPASVSNAFEMIVGAMLVMLGLRALWRARVRTASVPVAGHTHWRGVNAHTGDPDHLHVGPWTFAWRPLSVGLVHGLAGSGALTALVMAELPTFGTRVVYMALFGIGSAVGMALLTGMAGWQLSRMGPGSRLGQAITLATGAVSVVLGGWWGWTATLALVRA